MKNWLFLKSVKDFANLFFLSHKDAVLFVGDPHKYLTINDCAFSPIIDSFEQILNDNNFNTIQIFGSPSFINYNKCFGNTKNLNVIYLTSYLIKKIFSEKYRIFFEKFFFRIVLNKLKPRVVFGLGLRPSLCEACHDKKIPCVEIMHGYGYDPNVYFWDNCKANQMPSDIWVFDDTSKESIISLFNKRGLIKSVKKIPHIWSVFLREYPAKIKIPSIKKVLQLPKRYKRLVLFSLQWCYENEDTNYREFHNILENGYIPKSVIEAVEQTKSSVFWLFRRHPFQVNNKKYKNQELFLKNLKTKYKNIEWEFSSRLPIFSILQDVDAHLTMSSMTCYEAASYHIRSLILCPNFQIKGVHSFYFSDLVKNKMAYKREAKASEIVKFVTSVTKRKVFSFDLSFCRLIKALSQFR